MPPRRASLTGGTSVFVRPLTPRDSETCHSLALTTTPPHPSITELVELLRFSSDTSLGIFTTSPVPPSTNRPPTPSLAPHEEILLGFIIGTLDTGSGEGATLTVRGMWVRDQEGVGLVLLKGFCDRMRDARVAKRIVREMSGEEKEGVGEGMGGQVLGWYKEAGFAVRMEDGDGARLVMDCF